MLKLFHFFDIKYHASKGKFRRKKKKYFPPSPFNSSYRGAQKGISSNQFPRGALTSPHLTVACACQCHSDAYTQENDFYVKTYEKRKFHLGTDDFPIAHLRITSWTKKRKNLIVSSNKSFSWLRISSIVSIPSKYRLNSHFHRNCHNIIQIFVSLHFMVYWCWWR